MLENKSIGWNKIRYSILIFVEIKIIWNFPFVFCFEINLSGKKIYIYIFFLIYNFNFLIISRYFHFFLFFLSLSCFWSTYENNSMKGDNLFSIVRGEDYLLSGERLIYDLQVLQKKKKKKERFNTVKSVAEIEKLEDKEKGEKGNMCWPSSLYPPHNFWMTLFQGKGGWSRIVVSTRFQNVGRWPIVLQCFSKLKSQFFISNIKRKKKSIKDWRKNL